MEFEEERDTLTVSVEGTAMSEGWHVRTKWDPAIVRLSLHSIMLESLYSCLTCRSPCGMHSQLELFLCMQVKKAQADEFIPGKGLLPHCCVLASWKGVATAMGTLNQMLQFSGAQTTLKSYLLYRGEQYAKSHAATIVSTIY